MRPPSGQFADTGVVHELVRGAWTSSDVAGRQLSVGFPPVGDPASLLFLPADPAAPRVATIRLMALDEDGGDATPVVGEAIAGGTVLSGTDGSSPAAGRKQRVLVATEAARTAGRDRATSLTTKVDAATFPTIEVALDVRDGDGEPVEGLAAKDLDIKEDGVSIPFQLIANTRPPAPRVLVVWDGSGSVDEAWPNADDRRAFERSIAETLTTIAGSTPIETQVVSLGGAAQPDLWARPDAASLQAAMSAVTVSTSDVWKTSGDYIPRSGASVAVLVSDGVSTLEDPGSIAGWKEDLSAAGVPVVVLPVGTTDDAAIDEIVARSAGERLAVKAPDFAERLGAMVGDRAAAAAATTYRLHYSAPLEGPATRTVSVAVTGGSNEATGAYDVPPEADRGIEPGVAGLYVTISIGGRSARRRLGGIPLSDRGEPTGRPAQADIDRCRSALMGMHTIAFEPERPSSAQLLDDAITGLLSYEAVEAAWPPGSSDGTPPSEEDAAQLLTAVQEARWFPTPAVMMLNDPTPDLRVPRSRDLGVVLYHVEPVAGSVRMATDVVPQFNRSLAMVGDDASRSTMRASVVASVREGWLADESAYGELSDAELVAIRPFDGPPLDWPAQRERALDDLLAEYSGWIRLVPRNPAGAAMWVIDPETGAATAVGGLGAGQGVMTCQGDDENTQALNLALTGISLGCGVAGNVTVIQILICNGFTVYGVYALAKGSFTTPINFGFALNVAGAMLSIVPLTKGSGWAVNPKNWDPKSMANRAVAAALQAMLAVIAMGTWCD